MTDELSVTRLTGLDRGSGVPRYRQITEQLAQLIADAVPGTRLPSEHDIARHLDVSRATAIQSLRELEQRGLVHRRQGRGSFVADTGRAVRSGDVGFLPSFSQDLRDAGRVTRERVLSCVLGPAPADAAAELDLPEGAPVWCVNRVIHADGDPVIHATSWLAEALYPNLDTEGVEAGSLYEFLQARYGLAARPNAAEETWTAHGAPRATARVLDLAAGAPVMRVQRRALLADGTPAEYALSYVRAEAFAVSVRFRAGHRPTARTAPLRVAEN